MLLCCGDAGISNVLSESQTNISEGDIENNIHESQHPVVLFSFATIYPKGSGSESCASWGGGKCPPGLPAMQVDAE